MPHPAMVGLPSTVERRLRLPSRGCSLQIPLFGFLRSVAALPTTGCLFSRRSLRLPAVRLFWAVV